MRIVTIPSALTLLLLSACAFDPQPTTDEDVIGQLVECQTSIALLQEEVAELGDLKAFVEALQANDELQDGRLDDLDEEIAQSVLLLTSSTTVTVSDAEGLLAALDTLDRYRLAREVTYTIELEDGTYTFSEPLNIRHPDGASLRIVGNTSAEDAVTLQFWNDVDGVVVEQGNALGLLAGVTIQANATTSAKVTGILAETGASVTLGDMVQVENFIYAIRADGGSTVMGAPSAEEEGWLTVTGCTKCVMAENGSHVSARYVVAEPIEGGSGLYANLGSSMDVRYGMVTDGYQGFVVTQGSAMWAENASAWSQESEGFQVGQVSSLEATNSATEGSNWGVQVLSASYGNFLNASLEGTSASVAQGNMGVADVAGADIPDGVSSSNNDVTDFVLGN